MNYINIAEASELLGLSVCPVQHLCKVGTANACVELLPGNLEAQTLFASGSAYSRGEIDKVLEQAQYLLNRRSGFGTVNVGEMLWALRLYALIEQEQATATESYDIFNFRILSNNIAKFARDGRNANLRNGKNSLFVTENFTVFNFQSLFANKTTPWLRIYDHRNAFQN